MAGHHAAFIEKAADSRKGGALDLTNHVTGVVVPGLCLLGGVQPCGGLGGIIANVLDVPNEMPFLIVALRLAPVSANAPICYDGLLSRVSLYWQAPATPRTRSESMIEGSRCLRRICEGCRELNTAQIKPARLLLS